MECTTHLGVPHEAVSCVAENAHTGRSPCAGSAHGDSATHRDTPGVRFAARDPLAGGPDGTWDWENLVGTSSEPSLPHLRNSADMVPVAQGSHALCLCTSLASIPPPCGLREFPFAFVLGFLLRVLHSGLSYRDDGWDFTPFRLKACPPFHLCDRVCDQAIALIVVERIEDTFLAALQRLGNVVESNKTWLDQLLVIGLLDVAVEFFGVEVVTRRYQASPHKGPVS